MRLQQGRLEADLGQQPGDMLGGQALSRPGMISTIRRVDPDQVAAQARDFVLRGRGRGGWVLRHPPIVAFALPPGGVALFCSMGSVLMSGRAGCSARASGRRPWRADAGSSLSPGTSP